MKHQKENGNIKIINNPIKNTLIVQQQIYGVDEVFTIELINQVGMILFSQKLSVSSSITKVDVSQLLSGLYFVRFKNKNEVVKTDKIIIIE